MRLVSPMEKYSFSGGSALNMQAGLNQIRARPSQSRPYAAMKAATML